MIATSLPQLFMKQAALLGKKTVFEYKLRRNEPYRRISWRHLSLLVQEAAYGLIELGAKQGDNIAILSNTRFEWALSDLAILSIGAVVVPIYPTLPSENVIYILNNSNCKIVILEDKGQLQKIRSNWNYLSNIKYVIVMEDLGDLPHSDPRIISLKDLKDRGKLNFSKDPQLIDKHISSVNLNDLATIIYTSGTTGPPKGVILTHKNILSVLSSLPRALPLKQDDKFLSFLPLSHVLERVGCLHYALYSGVTVAYCSSAEQVQSSLLDSNTTIMLVVPRLLEKIYTKINHQVSLLPEAKKNIFEWAFNISKKYFYKKCKNKFLVLFDLPLFIQNFIAKLIVFNPLKSRIAPKIRCFISGGAPLSKEIAEFFFVIGMPVLEGYGLTETAAPAAVNTLKNFKLGTVGKPIDGIKVKIADDGEILLKGPSIFAGYYGNDDETSKTLRDGWFSTGDIGFVDEEGFLKITDRKKDIIVNSAGKNIAPQNIENSVRTSQYISNIVVVGDKRKYLSALVTLNDSKIIDYLKASGIVVQDGVKNLSESPEIIKLIDKEVKLKTALFADYEQIRKFTLLPKDFSIEAGEVTPTLKIKRKFVEAKYKQLIDLMYPPE